MGDNAAQIPAFSQPVGTGTTTEELPAALRPGIGSGTQRHPPPTNGATTDGAGEDSFGNPWAEQSGALHSPGLARVPTNNPYLRQGDASTANSQAAWRTSPTFSQSPRPPAAPPPPPPAGAPPAPPSEPWPSQGAAERPLSDQRQASWETAERLSVPQIGQPLVPAVAETQINHPPQSQRPESSWWEVPNEMHTESLLEAVELPSDPPRRLPAKSSLSQATTASVEAMSVRPGILIDDRDGPPQPSQQRPPPLGLQGSSSNVSIDAKSATPQPPPTPQTQARRQKNEHYPIKHINWYDSTLR